MARGRTRQVMVDRVRDGGAWRGPDEVAVEEPLEIRLDDHLVTTTMRTPGNDFELAVGFLHAEGLLGGAPVQTVRYCGTGSAVDTEFNVVTVETGGMAPVPVPRLTSTTSACGICGSATVDELCARLRPFGPDEGLDVDDDVLRALPDRVEAAQAVFAATGGLHAAAAFTPQGEVVLVREDVGRHNAVDKVAGRLLLDGGLPATGLGLFASGRAGFEIVQKAWAAGFSLVVAVGAPTSLAVETARAAGMGLVGFLRPTGMNRYA